VTNTSRAQVPLEAVRVLDLSRALSGPYVGRILSDLGADVVKVSTPSGDISQYFGAQSHGLSGLFTQLNAGKRNIAVDLGTTDGVDTVRQLSGTVDVLIENFRPGVMAALGLGWEHLRTDNPGLVMLSISGFGQDGPEASRQAYAPVIHGESGLIGRQAELDGRAPTDVGMALSDALAGLHGAIAVLAALRARDLCSTGQHIDLSMLEAILATDENMHFVLDENLPIWPARGGVWETCAGPLIIAADPKQTWFQLATHHGLTDPSPAGADIATKAQNRRAVVARWILQFDSRDELIAALEAADLAWGEVRTPSTLLESPTLVARPPFTEIDDRGGGRRKVVRMPYRFSHANCEVRGPAAYPGEHTETIKESWLNSVMPS